MGKSKKSKSSKKEVPREEEEEFEEEELSVLESEEEIDDEDIGEYSDNDNDNDNSGGFILDDEDESDYNAEARALRQAIAEGKFDSILQQGNKKTILDNVDDDDEAAGEDSNNEDDNNDNTKKKNQPIKAATNMRALMTKTTEIENARINTLPWAETFEVTSTEPLPFNDVDKKKNFPDLSNEVEEIHDVHDDLKREVCFYNVALEAVKEAKMKCKEASIPFTRPEDFFAEMVKTDEHMAKVKDRLIFESKKISAFEQRKSNKEQKLRTKEAKAKKLQEKAKQKKDNLKAVDSWAKSAAANRLNNGNVHDNEDDPNQQRYLGNGPSAKRQAYNKKYGFGGKRGRFKTMDAKMIDDTSKFNPRGNFGGIGTKSSGGGNKRPGKRARDASRSKRSRT